jgi:hypothetical protein
VLAPAAGDGPDTAERRRSPSDTGGVAAARERARRRRRTPLAQALAEQGEG